MRGEKRVALTIRLTVRARAIAERRARAEGRSVACCLERLILADEKKNGDKARR